MEALTDQQARLVGDDRSEVTDIQLILLPTIFSGMSPVQFCDDCLLAIVDNPSAFLEPNAEGHTLEQDREAIWCACGVTYHTMNPKSRYGTDWVKVNRLKMRHISDALT